MFNDGVKAKDFMLAGNARLTLVSERTGVRFTYKVVQPKGKPHFVQLLTGPDNSHDYTFMGTIFDSVDFRPGRRSRIGITAPSMLAFQYAWRALQQGKLPNLCQVWHEGRCGRCARPLTDPASIESGLGPICADKE